ncbi:MAG: hypothetical protein ACYSR8_10905 [Planctomycetota bacterium]|jgi:hypothetical protein
MRILTIALLTVIILAVAGCCDLKDSDYVGRNACLKTWYGLEPDPENPEIYKFGHELWLDEAFGPGSGWDKSMIRLFGSKQEKENLRKREAAQLPYREAAKSPYLGATQSRYNISSKYR